MTPPLDILIVGCSIAGPTLATFLLSSGLPASDKPRVTIVERSSAPHARGQNVDIRRVGVTIIRKLGLEAEIRAATTGEEGVQWVDAQNRVWGSIEASSDETMHSPTSDIEIMRGRLGEILWKRSKSVSEKVKGEGGAGIEYIFGDHIQDMEQDGMKVHVCFAKSGTRRSYDLVVGADGLHSQTRAMVWGAEGETSRVERLGVYGAFFSIPKAKTDTMWRRCYHAPGRRVIMSRPHEHSGLASLFLYTIRENDRLVAAATSQRDDVQLQKALMKDYFEDAGWESERIVEEMMATKDFYFDMLAQVKMDKWSKGRVVLMGDAAYCASPLSGMGTTLAMLGAYHLAGTLLRRPGDLATACLEYQEAMRPHVDRAQEVKLGAQRIMHPDTAWRIWAIESFIRFIVWTGLVNLLMRFTGPEKNAEQVEDYGLQQLPEWDE